MSTILVVPHPHPHVLVPQVKTRRPEVSSQVYSINTASGRKGDIVRGRSLNNILPTSFTVMDSLGLSAWDPNR